MFKECVYKLLTMIKSFLFCLISLNINACRLLNNYYRAGPSIIITIMIIILMSA